MKKFTLNGLLIVLLSLCSLAAQAYDLSKNGGYYNKLYNADGSLKTHSGLLKAMELTYKDTNYNSYSGSLGIVTYCLSGYSYYTEGIGDRACYNCTNLTTVSFNEDLGAGNTLYIGDEAFYNCTSLSSIPLVKTCVASIGDYAFYNCSSLTEAGLDLPNTLETIGNYTFANCTSLTTLDLSYTKLTSIGDYAFYNCTNLTEIKLPSTVTSIGKYAFQGCTSLTSIEIPASVTSIGAQAFYNCTKLNEVTYDAASYAPSSSNPIFYSYNPITTVTIGSDVTTMPEYLFDGGCSTLTTYGAQNETYILS